MPRRKEKACTASPCAYSIASKTRTQSHILCVRARCAIVPVFAYTIRVFTYTVAY